MPKGEFMSIDMSQFIERAREMGKVVGDENLQTILRRTFTKVEGHLRSTLPPELRQTYHVMTQSVRRSIGRARMQTINGQIGCVIPIKAERSILGSGDFPLVNPTRTYNAQRRAAIANARRNRQIQGRGRSRMKRRQVSVRANVLQASVSTLPNQMPSTGRSSYGGFPPFLMRSSVKGKFIVMTRKTRNRLPIIRVPGIAVPQMPLNRSYAPVQNDIADYCMERLEHEYSVLVNGVIRRAARRNAS